MRLGILGGSFDPIHVGHVRLAIEAREHLGLDEVVLEVARVSPFKVGQSAASAETRLRMTRAAVDGIPGLRAGDTELGRDGPSYTIDTLRAYAGNELALILGSDALAEFQAWREWQAILQFARLAVAERPGSPARDAIQALPAEFRDRVVFFPAPLLDVSSTDIRARVREGRCLRYLVPDSVIQIIEEERLYL